jgi:hypothetical protein
MSVVQRALERVRRTAALRYPNPSHEFEFRQGSGSEAAAAPTDNTPAYRRVRTTQRQVTDALAELSVTRDLPSSGRGRP